MNKKDLEIWKKIVCDNGYCLQFLKDDEQTYDICLSAIIENPFSLQFVKNQTEELCLLAIKDYPHSLDYVRDKTFTLIYEALSRDITTKQYFDTRLLSDAEYEFLRLKFNI